jgi:hypothetical protein
MNAARHGQEFCVISLGRNRGVELHINEILCRAQTNINQCIKLGWVNSQIVQVEEECCTHNLAGGEKEKSS